MKNKILAVLVCAAVMLTTGCSSRSDILSDFFASSGNNSSSAVISRSEKSEEPQTPQSMDKFSHGKTSGTVYASEFLGVRAQFPDDWTFLDDSYLAQQNNIADMTDKSVSAALNSVGALFEMIVRSDGVANINIIVQNLDVTNGGRALDADTYLDFSLDVVKEQYNAAGIDLLKAERSTAIFLGKNQSCTYIKLSNHGTSMVQKGFLISRGKYLATVTFTGESDAEVSLLIDMFMSL